MFQTDLIIFLQSFSTPFLDAFFLFITGLGDEASIQAIVIILLFGVNYRKGFLLIQLILATAIATGVSKNFFALPRPFNVDVAVRAPGYALNPAAVSVGKGAETFWGLLPEAAIQHFRMHLPNSFGFPSGHTSSAVTLWGAIALLFRKWWITAVCLMLIGLVPFSRLYLGRHFPADILGGCVLGAILLFLFYRYAFENRRLNNLLFTIPPESGTFPRLTAACGFLIPVLFIGLNVQPEYAAMWLGFNIGFYLVWKKGIPDDKASILIRISRVAMACALFYALDRLAAPLIGWCKTAEADMLLYLVVTGLLILFIWLATEAMVKLGWMNRA